MKHCPSQDCVHLAETGRPGEFRDEIQACSDCGTTLVVGDAPEPDLSGRVRWGTAMVVPIKAMAAMAKRSLISEGIPCEMRRLGPQAPGIVPEEDGSYELAVPEHLMEEAADHLSRLPMQPVALPEGDDIEFVDMLPEVESDDPPPVAQEHEPEYAEDACPRCGSSTITRATPDLAAGGGLLRRMFRARKTWSCLACGHGWS